MEQKIQTKMKRIVFAALLAFPLLCAAQNAESASALIAEGKAAPTFTLKSPEGKNVSLSDFRGKYLLIDFWASWCGPCMNEMPNIVDIYNSYKDKGLGIIGLSLDSDYKRWKEATQANNMTWLQLSELRGWDSEVAKVNSVQAIPHTIIIDKNGNILATGLRGEDLKQFVAEALKK